MKSINTAVDTPGRKRNTGMHEPLLTTNDCPVIASEPNEANDSANCATSSTVMKSPWVIQRLWVTPQ